MLSLRSVARSGVRAAVPRLTASSVRRTAVASPALKASAAAFVSRTSAFSTSSLLQAQTAPAASGEVDAELSAKLETELKFENEVQDEATPPTIKEFLENGPFELSDKTGHDQVYLSRKYGDEAITVSFTTGDLNNFENDMLDEELDEEYGAKDLDGEGGEEGAGEGESPPCRLHIVVEKPGKTKGALSIEATSTDSGMMIESLYYYEDARLAHGKTINDDYDAQKFYPGPPFGTLDEDLQILMERFLEERGINQQLALFASDYMEYKEQNEYVSWLSNVKKFVDA